MPNTILFRALLLPRGQLSFPGHSSYHYYYCAFNGNIFNITTEVLLRALPLPQLQPFFFWLLLLPILLPPFSGHLSSHNYYCFFQVFSITTSIVLLRALLVPLQQWLFFRTVLLPLLLSFSGHSSYR